MSPTIAVGAIIVDGDRVLLIRRGQPPAKDRWSVPGGKVEPGETLQQACAREVREETGLDIEVGPQVEVVERMGDGYHYLIHDFRASVRGGKLAAASDCAEARWVTLDEAAALPTTEGLLPVLQRAFQARR